MVLYLLFFVTAAGVVVIAVDPGDPDVMHRPPRDPKVPITNRTAVILLDPLRRGALRWPPWSRWWPGPTQPSTTIPARR